MEQFDKFYIWDTAYILYRLYCDYTIVYRQFRLEKINAFLIHLRYLVFKTLIKVCQEYTSQIFESVFMIHTFLWSSQSVGLHDLVHSPFFLFSLFQTLGIITFNLSTRGGPFHPFHPNYTFYFKTSRENAKNNDGKGYQGHLRSAEVILGRWYYSKIS